MAAGRFCGPLAGEFAAFAATLEASATASKTTLTQLRALDRYTAQRGLPSGTIDENLAKAWLADCATRAPNTRRARYYLLRRFCRFLAARCPGTFVPAAPRPGPVGEPGPGRRVTGEPGVIPVPVSVELPRCGWLNALGRRDTGIGARTWWR